MVIGKPVHSPVGHLPVGDQSASEGWQEASLLLVLTYSRMEQYLPEVLQNLDQFWPNRPDTFVVTDGSFDGANVIRAEHSDFAVLLQAAVREVRRRAPEKQMVFLLLEDLCPLWPVDELLLDRLQAVVRESGGKALCLHWWNRPRVPWKDGRWPHASELSVAGVQLVRMAKYYRCYNALTPGLWDLDHLEDVIDRKVGAGKLSPWLFERPLGKEEPDHYVVDGVWPTLRHGFRHKGEANPMILKRDLPASALLTRLQCEAGERL